MAYNVYIACDKCGECIAFPCNVTYSMTRAIKRAKKCGWKVKRVKGIIGSTDFLCPECAEKEKEEDGEHGG